MILFLLDISLWKILLDLVLLFFGQANREFYIELDVEITLGERLVEVLSINLNVLLGHTFIADLLNVVRTIQESDSDIRYIYIAILKGGGAYQFGAVNKTNFILT